MPRPSTQSRKKANYFGHWGEFLAMALLMTKGYRILERNYLGGGGEIDLIIQRGEIVAFVEVKSRLTMAAALEAIDHQKLVQVAKAARHWLSSARSPEKLTLRFDAVLIAQGQLPRHMANIAELPALS